MPKSKYETIYKDLKQKIEEGIFPQGELLPSENRLIKTYGCSRNTVRRAIARLVTDGYVQTMQGKGVRNIYVPVEQASYTSGSIESFKESSLRNHKKGRTKVLHFTELCADEHIARHTGFPVGTELYYIQRVHYPDDIPLILNHNYFRKSETPGLNAQIAEDYNCLAVISSHTYNSDGVMFEFTQSRHHPDYFRFQDNALRKG